LQSIPYFLLNKESWQHAFSCLKDEPKIPADELIILRDLIIDRAERAAAGHAEPFLQL